MQSRVLGVTLLLMVSLSNAYLAGRKAVGKGTLKFVMLGDWGGQDWFPYVNVAELRVCCVLKADGICILWYCMYILWFNHMCSER